MWVHTCQWMLQYRIFQAGKMLWTLLSKASTMIFCCIMSKARLTETKWAGGHISVGPKTEKKKQNIFNLGIFDPVLLAVFEFWFHKQKNSWNCTLLVYDMLLLPMARFGICIRFFSLNVVTFSKCLSRNAKVARCEVGIAATQSLICLIFCFLLWWFAANSNLPTMSHGISGSFNSL